MGSDSIEPTSDVGALVKDRYEGSVDRVTFYLADPPGENTKRWEKIDSSLKS